MNDDIRNEINTDEGLAKACVVSCLETNHANTFALLEVMRACPVPRPYRDVENEVKDLPVMHMTHQNAHVLCDILVNCGALEKIEVPEEPRKNANDDCPDAATAEGTEGAMERHISFASPVDGPDAFDPDFDWDDEEDMPIDYMLVITPAGQAALDDYEPAKRLSQIIEAEEACYHDVYRCVLQFCADGEGVTSDNIISIVMCFVLVLVAMVLLKEGSIEQALLELGDEAEIDGGDIEESEGGEKDASEKWLESCERLCMESKLSAREREVLLLLGRGRTIDDVADELTVSFNTAKTHVKHIYTKTGVHSRAELRKLIEDGMQQD